MGNLAESTPVARKPALTPSGLTNGVLPLRTLALVSCGGIGALFFTVVYLLEGVTRSGYNAWQQPISALSLGPGGWAQQVNFVVFGVLVVFSAVGWYQVLSRASWAIWFPALQGIAGLSLIGAGVFSMDPLPGYQPGAAPPAATAHGMLQTIFAWMLILSLFQGCIALGAFCAHTPHWRGWAVYSYLTGALILTCWVLFVNNATGPQAGFIERVSAGSHALWLCLITAALPLQNRMRRG